MTEAEQLQTLQQNVVNTCNLVSTMMTTDNLDQQTATAVNEMLKLVLNSDAYINSVRQQVKTIIADGNFNQNDIPSVLTIVLQSKAFLQTTLNSGAKITVNLNMSTLKYVIFGVLHFVMVLEKANPALITSLDTTYSPLWNLVAVDPQQLSSDVSTITQGCFPCFSKKK
jgi:hypothetical protein